MNNKADAPLLNQMTARRLHGLHLAGMTDWAFSVQRSACSTSTLFGLK